MTSTSSRPGQPRKVLAGLQYLRGFAAIYVVLYHLSGRFYLPVFAYGYLGVQLFFIISGFIITYVHGGERGTSQALTFLRKRLIRIYPAYWLALLPVLLAFYLLPSSGLPWHREPVNMLRNLFLLQWPAYSILGVAWSLVYEVLFYALFGLWVIWLELPLLALLAGWWLLLMVVPAYCPTCSENWLLFNPYNFYFLAGCGLGLVYPYLRYRLAGWVFVGGLLLFLLVPFLTTSFWIIFAASLLLCSLALLYQPVQSQRWLLGLGDSSYAIYLTHVTILATVTQIVARVMPQFAKAPVLILPLLVLCLAGGLYFYRWLETPVRTWLQKL